MTLHTKQLGFTLIELIISIAIIGLITGIVIFNQASFSENLSLVNTSNSIELSLRESQSYSIAVREFAAATSEFNVGYGVSFNLGNQGSSASSYLSFVDRGVLNGYYDTPLVCSPGTASECLMRNNIAGKNSLSDLCVIEANNNQVCGPTIARVDVSFKRPSPDAVITFFNNGGNVIPFPNNKGARIILRSPSGLQRSVYVYGNGQISIQ